MAIANLLIKIGADISELVDKSEKATQSVEKTTAGIQKSLNRIGSIGAGLAAAVTLPIVGIGAAALKMGIDAVESANLIEVSFGDMKKAADDWSAGLSKSLGLNRFETEKMAGVLFNMTKSMGFSKDAAFEMSTGVVKLAADMASFRNIPMEEALQKIRAGLVGEAEPLKAIGILVDDNTVKSYAYAHGIAKQGTELTQQQKVLARYGAILQQTSNDQGDLARTLDSPANQLRIMKSRIEEATTSLGMALVPAASEVISVFSKLVPYLQSAVQWFTDLPKGAQTTLVLFAGLAAAVGPVLIVFSSLSSSVIALIPLMTTLGTATGITGASLTTFAATAVPIVAALAGIGFGVYKVVGAVQDFKKALDEGRGAAFLMQRDTDNWVRRLLGLGDAHEKVTPEVKKLEGATGAMKEQMDAVKSIMDKEIASLRNQSDTTSAAAKSQKEAAKATSEHAEALRDIAKAQVPLTEAQKRSIAAFDDQGVAVGTMAKALRVSDVAVQNYIESLKNFKDVSKNWVDLHKEMAKVAHDLATKTIDDARKAALDEANVRGQLQDRMLADLVKFHDKNQRERLSDYDAAVLTVRQEAEKTLSVYRQMFGESSAIFKLFSDEVAEDVSNQFQKISQAQAEAIANSDEEVKKSEHSITDLATAFTQMAQVAGGSFGKVLEGIGSIITASNVAAESIKSIRLGEAKGGKAGLLDMASGYLALAGAAIQTGKALRPLLGIHHGKLGDALGTNRDGRLLIEQLAEMHGGFDQLHSDLLRLGPAGEQMWIQLTQKVDNGKIEEARVAVDSVTAAFERARKGLETAVSGVNSKADVFAQPFRTALADLDKLTSQFDKESLKLAKAFLKKPGKDDAEAAQYGLDQKSQLFDQLKLTSQVEGSIETIIAKVAEMRERMQPEFERIGIFVAATFAGMVRENGDAIGAIEALSPAFKVLEEGVNDFGLASTGTIDQLLGMFTLVNDAVQGPILKSIQATGQIFTGLQDAGILTSELFQTVGEDIGASFRELEAKGGDVAAAMALSQPVLQKLWEAQQIYGDITDETTQKVLKQAAEQGLVGAHMKDVNQKILDVLISIAEVFGAKLPEAFSKTSIAAKNTARDVESAFSDIDVPDVHVRVKYDVDDAPGDSTPGYATGTRGGYVNFGSGTLAMLHGNERIMTEHESLGIDGGSVVVYIGNEQLDSRVVKVARADAARGNLRPRAASGRSY